MNTLIEKKNQALRELEKGILNNVEQGEIVRLIDNVHLSEFMLELNELAEANRLERALYPGLAYWKRTQAMEENEIR